MTFLWPNSLWLMLALPLLPVVYLWLLRRRGKAALRYMIKIFLVDLWSKWREIEGLPVTPTYNEARRGYAHGAEAAE